jgi:hypothetical protein
MHYYLCDHLCAPCGELLETDAYIVLLKIEQNMSSQFRLRLIYHFNLIRIYGKRANLKKKQISRKQQKSTTNAYKGF